MHLTQESAKVISIRRRWGRLIVQITISGLFTAFPLAVLNSALIANIQPGGTLTPQIGWSLLVGIWLLCLLPCGYFWSRLVLDTCTRFSTRGIWRPSLVAPRFIPWSSIDRVDFFLWNYHFTTPSHTVILYPDGFRDQAALKGIIEAYVPPTALPIHYYEPPQYCPTCQQSSFSLEIGRANRAGERATRFSNMGLIGRFAQLFVIILFFSPIALGLMAQFILLSGGTYLLTGWCIVVLAIFAWYGIRDGLKGTPALRYLCTHCGAHWIVRCGDDRAFETIKLPS